MKKFLQTLLAGALILGSALLASAQNLVPFDNCPGVSVAVTRPGFNLNLVPHQIYLVNDSSGEVQPSGNPIDLQINGFGLNNTDGFLYGMHQVFNLANPYLTRVDKNGDYITVGTIPAPEGGRYKVGLVNTTAGTMDDEDNYYFTAVLINLQNILLPPEIFVGKVEKVSHLREGDRSLRVHYKKLGAGSCLDELLSSLTNPLDGVLQDIAFNPSDGRIYTYLPGSISKIAHFDPRAPQPSFVCVDPTQANPSTADLSGLYFNADTALVILTTDGRLHKADVGSGEVVLVGQSTLPLLNGNLRGDMASCVGKRGSVAFDGCPGLALAITRPGLNDTGGPHQVFTIDPGNGDVQPVGMPINLQINGFGLNNQDGFLYGMHEVSDIFAPTLARVDRTGTVTDINIIPAPGGGGGGKVGIINTAAATMDGRDNYYFTAVVIDTLHILSLPRLYLGTIKNVSKLEEGDEIRVKYDRIYLGDCIDEILMSLALARNGLLQDIAYNPEDGRIYTYIQRRASPSSGKLASFKTRGRFIIMDCITPSSPNIATQDLSGMHADNDGWVYLLTIDGKYYRANRRTGAISLIAQTSLPLLSNNLRGDMASCVAKDRNNREEQEEEDDSRPPAGWIDEDLNTLRVQPNPVNGDEMILLVESDHAAQVEMRIMDANGNPVQTRRMQVNAGANQLRVNVTNLQRGVFAVVLVYPEGGKRVVKFIRS